MTCNATTYKFVESYLEGLDCARALSIWLMFRDNEHKQLVEFDCNPLDYNDVHSFRLAYLATKFLSKANFLHTSIDLKKVALDKFKEAEDTCRSINLRGFHWTLIKEGPGEFLHSAVIRIIGSILGEFDPEEMIDSANWGPGVTTLIKGSDTSPVNKFRNECGTTRPLDTVMGDLYAVAYPNWDLSKREIQVGNHIVTVPKNSKTDRTIAIEPGLNLWFQKGIGTMIRRRLRRVGLDLNSQDRNQQLAKISSITGDLATVDFSSASDTITFSTVRALLPERWFTVMDILRSRFGLLGKNYLRYEKFSSMGNGFTFELESLIFYAIAIACCNKLQLPHLKVNVFGDDVILPVNAFPLFREVCEFYGFKVNTQKSYSSGYFRESCGSHYFSGISCKPFFLKEEIKSDLDVYKTANGVRRTAFMFSGNLEYCDRRFLRPWRLLFKKIRKPYLISEGYGDGGFIVNFDEATPARAKNGYEGYYSSFVAAIPIGYISDDHAVLLARLRASNPEISFGNKVNLRGRVRLSRKRLLIPRWKNLGPWY
jgi:hypothetical protein